MKYFLQKYKKAFFFLALLLAGTAGLQAQVTFRASAPNSVVKGEQFRLSYTLNEEGKDLRLPDLKGFDVLFGPSTSRSFSQQTVNGKTTSESSITYTYILVAPEEGTFSIAPASITVGGANYQSNSLNVKVLPPDKTAESGQGGGSAGSGEGSSPAPAATVSADDAFIRAIVSKNNIYEQEGFTVTFRLYTTLNITDLGRIEFPEFEGFMAEEVPIPSNQQLQMERYNGRNYYTADLKKSLLFPQRSGRITIPSGRLEMVFSVPSGKRVSTFFGTQEVMADVKRALVTNPLAINVRPLPEGKPAGFSNAVGTLTFTPSISTRQTRANEPITITLEISGTGNMKLIQNPEIKFPTNFEVYDPTVNNNFQVTTNGLTGSRQIEYLAIPRYEGNYNIPPIEFSYFDLNTNSYKTVASPEYSLQIAKGDPSQASANSYVNQQNVRIEQDIRFLKTGEPQYQYKNTFFAGSLGYWLWYLIPLVLLIVFYIFNRKIAKENANVALMRTRKANKMAIRRLKVAEKYLKAHDKARFYDEVLRALWGYFSDKLSIPVAHLTKDNIEKELSDYGIGNELIGRFMQILNTCEFARYAPAESDAAMDKLYNETIDAIGEMESKLKRK
ncbi:MAG: BatD family protein [Bacteroidia bacterium]|nr:BatD family protein [Bacteroidia bacterium]